MALINDTGRDRTGGRGIDLLWDAPDIDTAAKPKRDAKKLFLVIGLGVLSWVATYVGMLELIEANMGELPIAHKIIIGFSVAMLMTMVVWLLDQIFADIGWFTRLVYVGGYVFLTLISVGFGFGFYWKVLESRGEASRSAESAVGQVQTSLHAAITRLEQLQGTLDSLTAISTQKAENERATGLSCPNSRPGDGPRRKMREDDAQRFKFASDFVKGRIGTVKADIGALEADLVKIATDDKSIVDAKSGTRNEFMRNLGRKLDLTVTGFNAFRTDPQLKQIRIDLNERADKATFTDSKGGTYTCPDSQLTGALKGVVRAIDELPSLDKPKIATVEGSEAVIEAFRRLTATFYGALSFKLPPSPEELRELQKKAVQSVENAPGAQARINAMAEQAGLSKRDYVPLAIAIFVDLCLLFVSMGRPANRFQGLVGKMRAAERGPVIQILARFNEIHRDADIRENFEMFRHVVFDFHGEYYAAIPLNAPYRPNPQNGRQRQGYGVSDAEALLQEAHLLANLFSSFEKEKLFTRVHSPLLSTKTIQKRLRRQGSKFANAESFRVYRFKNGAWSEFILGAVMGAARRVEAEKRRRRVEDDIFRSREPEFGVEAATAGGASSRAGHDRDRLDAALAGLRPAPYAQPMTGFMPPVDGSETTAGGSAPLPPQPLTGTHGAAGWAAQAAAASAGRAPPQPFGPQSRGGSQTSPSFDHRVATSSVATPVRSMSGPPPPRFMGEAFGSEASVAVGENVVLHPAVARPSGPARGDADVTPVMAPETESIIALGPRAPVEAPAGHAEPMVTVEAVRETVTYTMPMDGVALPASLRKTLEPAARDIEADCAVLEPARSVQSMPSALPPPLPESGESLDDPPPISAPEGAAETDDTMTMALRLRPPGRDS